MTTRTTRRRTDAPPPLTNIAADLRAALSTDTGPAWVQRRWAPDIDIVLQRNRDTQRWRLAATCTNRQAPSPDTLTLLATAFGAPPDDWEIVAKPRGVTIYQVAQVTWTERL